MSHKCQHQYSRGQWAWMQATQTLAKSTLSVKSITRVKPQAACSRLAWKLPASLHWGHLGSWRQIPVGLLGIILISNVACSFGAQRCVFRFQKCIHGCVFLSHSSWRSVALPLDPLFLLSLSRPILLLFAIIKPCALRPLFSILLRSGHRSRWTGDKLRRALFSPWCCH